MIAYTLYMVFLVVLNIRNDLVEDVTVGYCLLIVSPECLSGVGFSFSK